MFQWGVLAAVITMAVPEMAWATAGVGDALTAIKSSELQPMPAVISAVCYIGGAILAASGAMKLKAHAEAPAQEKMAPGIARLLAGGAIAALPALLGTMTTSAHLGAERTYTSLSGW